MDNIAREILKTKLKSFKGTSFQDAVDRIFLIIYEAKNFVRVKQKRDKGSDGILNQDTILAAYAPEVYYLRDFKKKTKSDYDSYNKNWSKTHKNWTVVTNLETTAEMITFVSSLRKGSIILCIERLLELVGGQTWTKKSSIFKALDIPERYLTNDVLATAVEDLIKLCDTNNSFHPYEKPVYIQDKIDLNVCQENVEYFLDEYEESLAVFSVIQHAIKSHNINSVSAIRSKIRNTYMEVAGTFEEKFKLMVNLLSGEKKTDEYYKYHMRIVLLYFFEQCLFGIKTNEEKQA